MVGAELIRSEQLGTSFGFSMWVQGPKTLDHLYLLEFNLMAWLVFNAYPT